MQHLRSYQREVEHYLSTAVANSFFFLSYYLFNVHDRNQPINLTFPNKNPLYCKKSCKNAKRSIFFKYNSLHKTTGKKKLFIVVH